MKNCAKNKRCYIIGNGPSLTVSDLELLKDEDTFASNGIYKMFPLTDWRPNFYCVQDSIAFSAVSASLGEISEETANIFISMNFYKKYPEAVKKDSKSVIMYIRYVPPRNNIYRFSNDMTDAIYEGLSVTYSMLQLAIYMGYKEIFLLGIDHSYSIEVDTDGNIINQRNGADHFYKSVEKGSSGYPTKIREITNAYQSARAYAERKGVIIKNATRGGKLEVFERIQLEKALLKGTNSHVEE
jgi:hypothetical protein